jgi:hypothetical protein
LKNRKITTFLEKFKGVSARNDASLFIDRNRNKISEELIFDKCPYIGILYVELSNEYANFWYDSENGVVFPDGKRYLKLKILYVDKYEVTFVHYDSHHHNTVWLCRKYYGYQASYSLRSNGIGIIA